MIWFADGRAQKVCWMGHPVSSTDKLFPCQELVSNSTALHVSQIQTVWNHPKFFSSSAFDPHCAARLVEASSWGVMENRFNFADMTKLSYGQVDFFARSCFEVVIVCTWAVMKLSLKKDLLDIGMRIQPLCHHQDSVCPWKINIFPLCFKMWWEKLVDMLLH